MFDIWIGSGDLRKEVCEAIPSGLSSYEMQRIAKSIAFEYVEEHNLTLLYGFNLQASDYQDLFQGWLESKFERYASRLECAYKRLYCLEVVYFDLENEHSGSLIGRVLVARMRESALPNQTKVPLGRLISKCGSECGDPAHYKLFQDVQVVGDYRSLPGGNLVVSISTSTSCGWHFGSVNYNTVGELREKLKSYDCRRVLWTSLTPWDDWNDDLSSLLDIEDISLPYVMEADTLKLVY